MIGHDVEKAVSLLKKGQIVGFPTETVYGLAGNALDESAVLKIFKAKNRPFFDPLIVHLSGIDKISALVKSYPEQAQILARAFMPGPLTLLLPKKEIIPDLVTAGSDLVGLRVPSHPMAQAVLARLPFPVAAPSANPFGYISPTSAQHVANQLGTQIPYILDGGPTKVGVESTIIGFQNEKAVLYRHGGTTAEEIEVLTGMPLVEVPSDMKAITPGRTKSHYAPRTIFWLGDIGRLYKKVSDKRVGVLVFNAKKDLPPTVRQLVLAPDQNLETAARNLFKFMRILDDLEVDYILAEPLPSVGLGRAINERLRRAAADFQQ